MHFTRSMEQAQERAGRPLREVLVELYQTQTLDEIAEHFGVSTGTVSNWFFRLRIPTSHSKYPEGVA